MQFEDSNAKITEAITGRIVEYVRREEDGGIALVCRDGREVSLFVDKEQQIQLRGFGVTIVLPSLYGDRT